MPRLIAYGCSNTLGEGLPDCWNARKQLPLTTPSNYAWPSVLAEKLNIECVNLGLGGASNKYICNEILETDFRSDDLVVVLWTFYNRSCVFNDDSSVTRLLARDMINKNVGRKKQIYARNYYRNYYSDTDAVKDTHVRINLAKHYLDSKGIKNHHRICGISKNHTNKDLSVFPQPKWSSISLIEIIKYFGQDLALDNMHPGIESQKTFAEELYKELQE